MTAPHDLTGLDDALHRALHRAVGRHAASAADRPLPFLDLTDALAAVVRAVVLRDPEAPALRAALTPSRGAALDPDQLALVVSAAAIGRLAPDFQAGTSRRVAALVTRVHAPDLFEQLGASRAGAIAAAGAVTAHPVLSPLEAQAAHGRMGGAHWEEVREDAFHAVAERLDVSDLEPLIAPSETWRFTVSGLTLFALSLADSEYWFPCGAGPDPDRRLDEAVRAVAACWPLGGHPVLLRSRVRTSISRVRSMGLVRWRSKPASAALAVASGPP